MDTREDRRSRSRLVGWLCTVALASGCSVIFHADATQCSSTTDCLARGSAFANHICQAGTCVASPLMGSDAGPDASSPKDASGESAVGLNDAAAEAEVEAGPPPCKINDDCQDRADPTHPEIVCDRGTGACLQLTTDECPYVIGDFSGAVAAPILVGAFAELPPSAPKSHPSYINYQLAIDEFTIGGGIPGIDPKTNAQGSRMPVVVVCNGSGDSHVAMNHLVGDLHTPGVVAALDAVTLRTTLTDAYGSGTFIINPFGADSKLTALPNLTTGDVSLFWHMLGLPGDVKDAYAGFFPRMEAYVRTKRSLTGPIKVAAIVGNATDTLDLQAAVESEIRFNGMSVTENFNANQYMSVTIDSVLNNVDLSKIDVSDAITKLNQFQPNVIVSFAATEFVNKVLEQFELYLQGQGSTLSPFYLLGPYNMGSTEIFNWVGVGNSASTEARRTRLAGVGVAAASDTHVLDAYVRRFPTPSALGQENYYDAMYFLVYSLVGAGPIYAPQGANLAQGMVRLLGPGTSYDMGPSPQGDVFTTLANPNNKIKLFGTLGPPNFTLAKGTRVGEGSAYCVGRGSDSITPVMKFDVLTMQGGGAMTDAGAPALTGTFGCYSGM